MNLFILHLDPKVAASYYFDSHVIKIILEAVQMLSCAKLVLDGDSDEDANGIYHDCPKRYRLTHKNHPVSVWVRTSRANWDWTCDLVDALVDEWHYRYQHNKLHGCQPTFEWLKAHPPANNTFSSTGLTPFAQAMPDEFKHDDAITAYRNYYRSSMKAHLTKWRRRGPPNWFNGDESTIESDLRAN